MRQLPAGLPETGSVVAKVKAVNGALRMNFQRFIFFGR